MAEAVEELADELQHRERERHRSEQWFEAVFDDPNMLVALIDPDGTLRHVNETAFEYVDADRETVLGDPFPETPWWKDTPTEALERWIDRAITGEYVGYEAHLDVPDAGRFWVEGTFRPVVDETGAVVSIVVSARDVTERRRRERELRETKRRLALALEGSNTGVWEWDLASDEVTWSESLERLLGLEPGAFEGTIQAVERYVHPDDWPRVESAVERTVAHSEPYKTEFSLRHADGGWIWVEARGRLIADEGGDRRMIGILSDVTERKMREREARERERQLQRYKAYTDDVLDAIDDVFYVIDAEGFLQRWNRSLADVTGYSDAEIAEMHALEFFDEAEQPHIVAAIEEVLETGDARVESAVLTADGEQIPYEFVAVALEDLDGETVLTGIGRDISERVEKARQLSRLISNIPGLVYRVDNAPGWPTTFVSEGVADITGYDSAALERGEVSWHDIYAADVDWDWIWETVQTALERREPFQLIYPIQTADGERRWVSEQGRGVYAADGSVETIEGVIIDVTDQREYEQELEETRRLLERTITRLEASNERLEDFAYAASHDLQEPLRMVSSFLRLIEDREDGLSEESREFLAFAVDGAERMREMIESLLAYSRIETRGEPLEPVDLDAVFADVCDDLHFQLEESEAHLTADSLPVVEGDGNQLRQLFQNLLSNAVKYSGEVPPQIEVETERVGDEWLITVSDDGIGIDSGSQDRIFDVFERLHTREEFEGTGIGLALCERIVERHGGEIEVDSEPGQGTTFSFTLPAAADS
ncbi:hypothetical protein GCM10025298_02220 [Natronobiforma cellulositropha]